MQVIRGGTVVTETGQSVCDVGIEGEKISAIGENLPGDVIFDATGLHVFPGFFDAHVHFADEGLSHWEDFNTGGRAAVAGGVTTVMDMPLNDPMTTTAERFATRLDVIGKKTVVDHLLWAGAVPGNVAEMEPMAALGARAFKAFMVDVEGYSYCNTAELFDAMTEAARLGLPLGVHAESNELAQARTRHMRELGRNDVPAHVWSRDLFVEYEAIHRAIAISRETGCRLHVLHVNVPAALAEIAAAPNVVGEAQIGFLSMDEDDYLRHGTWARFSPPLRPRADVEKLWQGVLDGTLEYVISDHSGYPPKMKAVDTIWDAADGIPAVQTCYPVLMSEGVHKRGLSLERFVTLSSAQAARLYDIYPQKGAFVPGKSDADLAIMDVGTTWTLELDDLEYLHPWTPQAGAEITGRVVATLRRGELVFSEGQVLAEPGSGRAL
jgi:allantoinase